MDLRETVAHVIKETEDFEGDELRIVKGLKAKISYFGTDLNIVYNYNEGRQEAEVQEVYADPKENLIGMFYLRTQINKLDDLATREHHHPGYHTYDQHNKPPEQTQTSMNDGDEPYTPRAKQ